MPSTAEIHGARTKAWHWLAMPISGLFCLVATFSSFAPSQADEKFEAFIEQYCLRCHGSQKEEGDIRFDNLSRDFKAGIDTCLLYTSPSPRDTERSRMPSSA